MYLRENATTQSPGRTLETEDRNDSEDTLSGVSRSYSCTSKESPQSLQSRSINSTCVEALLVSNCAYRHHSFELGYTHGAELVLGLPSVLHHKCAIPRLQAPGLSVSTPSPDPSRRSFESRRSHRRRHGTLDRPFRSWKSCATHPEPGSAAKRKAQQTRKHTWGGIRARVNLLLSCDQVARNRRAHGANTTLT